LGRSRRRRDSGREIFRQRDRNNSREFRRAGFSALLAAAGGVNAENAADYARAGADILVTSAPYVAKPRDVQVKLTPK